MLDDEVLYWAKLNHYKLIAEIKDNPDGDIVYHHAMHIWARTQMLEDPTYVHLLTTTAYKHVNAPYKRWDDYNKPDEALFLPAFSTKKAPNNIAARRILLNNPKYACIRPDLMYYLGLMYPNFTTTLRVLTGLDSATDKQFEAARRRIKVDPTYKPIIKEQEFITAMAKTIAGRK